LLSTNRYEFVRSRSLFVLPLALLTLAGCGGGDRHGAAGPRHGVAGARHQTCAPGTYYAYESERVAYAAVVRSQAVARRRPGGAVLARFGRVNRNKLPTILGVRGARVDRRCAATWYRVQLPIRPNGITGWVPATQVALARINTRIVVDLSARRLTLYQGGRPVLRSAVAVGAPGTPTPIGRFYVNQRLIPTDPKGPYGPAAVGVSAFSNVLTGWAQGGPIGIHGTNEPWSIGHTDSNGCIRLPNSTARRLFKQVLMGTPVIIHP
jgi:lipoprotein-anchoring transpeptidase ErfK/SrfK